LIEELFDEGVILAEGAGKRLGVETL